MAFEKKENDEGYTRLKPEDIYDDASVVRLLTAVKVQAIEDLIDHYAGMTRNNSNNYGFRDVWAIEEMLSPEWVDRCRMYARRMEYYKVDVYKEKNRKIYWVTPHGETPTRENSEMFSGGNARYNAMHYAGKQQGVSGLYFWRMLVRDGKRKIQEVKLLPDGYRLPAKKAERSWTDRNDETCGGCKYYQSKMHVCEYIGITGHMRGCPVEGCTRKEVGEYIGLDDLSNTFIETRGGIK